MSDEFDEFDDDPSFWASLAPETLNSIDSVVPAHTRLSSAAPPTQKEVFKQPQVPPPRASQVPLKRPIPPAQQHYTNQQQQQRRTPAPPSQLPSSSSQFPPPPQFGTAKPSGILRPAQPPARKKPRVAGPGLSGAGGGGAAGGAEKKEEKKSKPYPRASLNAQGEVGFVDPNPWAGSQSQSVTSGTSGRVEKKEHEKGKEREEEEERDEYDDLPGIQLSEAALLAAEQGGAAGGVGGVGGLYRAEPQRGTTVSAGAPPPASVRQAVVAPPLPKLVQVQQGGINEQEKRELDELRREKAKLQAALAASQAEQAQLQMQVTTKLGENKIVRTKLFKAEAAHAEALRQEKRDKAELQAQLAAREKDLREAMEKHKVEEAFRRQEVATSAGPSSSRRSSSQRPSSTGTGTGAPGFGSANSQRFYAPTRQPSAAPVSPSAGRGSRAKSARLGGSGFDVPAPPVQPRFEGREGASGFGPSQPRKAEREGSMGPPKLKAGAGAAKGKGKGKEKERDRKGKGRASLAFEEDEGFGVDSPGHGHGQGEHAYGGGMDDSGFADATSPRVDKALEPAAEAEEEEAPFPWDWATEERDPAAELLRAVFAHTTLAPFEVEVAGGPAPSTSAGHSHHRLSSSAFPASTSSRAFPSTSSYRFGTSTALSRSSSGPSSSSAVSASSAPSPAPSGPFPTLHALLNLRFPASVPPQLVQHYELTARSLFTLLGRGVDPHHHSHHAEHAVEAAHSLAQELVNHLTSLLLALDAARLAGPMTALLRLLGTLVFLFPAEVGQAAVRAVGEVPVLPSSSSPAGSVAPTAAAATTAGEKAKSKDIKEGKKDRSALLPLLARIIARYGRPDPPAPPPAASAPHTLSGSSRLVPSLRSRRARIARPSTTSSSAGGFAATKAGGEDGPPRVQLERGKRERLLESVVGVVEGVAWRVASEGEKEGGRDVRGVKEAEEAFHSFVVSPGVAATLLDPHQPVGILLLSVRLLTLFACRPALFRPLLATKFPDSPDTRHSRLPLVDRIATLLAMPRAESAATHTLDLSLLSLALRLLTKHEDALVLVAESAAFVPELLAKMWRDVRTLWEWDGREVGGVAAEGLKRTTLRLSRLVHLLYYLAHAPHARLPISHLLSGGTGASSSTSSDPHPALHPYQIRAVNELFMSALGTLAFATMGGGAAGQEEGEGAMPSWAMEEGFEAERKRLVELGYLAQELLEDQSPLELEEVEVCFGPPDDDEEEGEEGDDGAEGLHDEEMLVDEVEHRGTE
ncbi:hypothetical protein JCM8097_000098 [Rhodosporidiobolus ruineniae]